MGGKRAAIYARISRDADDEGLGVARQEADCRKLAAQLGLDVVEVFVDNDLGASSRSRKPRPEYQRMLDDARARRFEVILAYSNSRITRRLMELEDLIKLHDATGVRIQTVVSGNDDLSTADGRMVARIKASVDAAEAERIAERVARKHLELAQKGQPAGGPRPFGWQEDRITLDPEESVRLREAIADVLDGATTAEISRQWNAAGLKTTLGRPWTSQAVKAVLRSPRIAGWRVHRDEIAVDKDGEPVKALSVPIVDDETWRTAVAKMRSPRRSPAVRRGARRQLLTGILLCGVCGRPLYGHAGKRPEWYSYRCSVQAGELDPHGNAITGKSVDAWVARQVLDAAEVISPTPLRSVEFGRRVEIEQEIGEVNDLIEDLMRVWRAREISGLTVFRNVANLEKRRDALEIERDALAAEVREDDDSELVTRETWEGLDVSRRRAIIERWVSAVYVRPASRRTSVLDEGRLEIVWKERRGPLT